MTLIVVIDLVCDKMKKIMKAKQENPTHWKCHLERFLLLATTPQIDVFNICQHFGSKRYVFLPPTLICTYDKVHESLFTVKIILFTLHKKVKQLGQT